MDIARHEVGAKFSSASLRFGERLSLIGSDEFAVRLDREAYEG